MTNKVRSSWLGDYYSLAFARLRNDWCFVQAALPETLGDCHALAFARLAMTGGRCGGSKPLRWLRCFQAKTFAKPYFLLFIILTLNEVKGENLYQTKNNILHFSTKSSE